MENSKKHFKKSNEKDELLRLLALGEKEIESGEGLDLETVLAEAKALFPRKLT